MCRFTSIIAMTLLLTAPIAGAQIGEAYYSGVLYPRDAVVERNQTLYRCKVDNWCGKSGTDWAYAPGTGQYWRQAWERLQAVDLKQINASPPAVKPAPHKPAEPVDLTQFAHSQNWDPRASYRSGDTVRYQRAIWRARHWVQAEAPHRSSTSWQLLGHIER